MNLVNRRVFKIEDFRNGAIGVTRAGKYAKYNYTGLTSEYPLGISTFDTLEDLIENNFKSRITLTLNGTFFDIARGGTAISDLDIMYLVDIAQHKELI